MKTISFETERLILRPTGEEDADFILKLLNTPKWLQFIGDRNVHTLEGAKTYIQTRIISQQKRLGFSNYTMIKKADLTKIGTCGLYDREGLEGIDIGFALLPEFENVGYAFEASHKLLKSAFEVFGLKEIKAITNKENVSSQRLLEKLGLIRVGTTQINPGEAELYLYSIDF